MFQKYTVLFLSCILICCYSISGAASESESSSSVIIKKIEIDGNKKTKRKVILREMTFQEGDTIEVHTVMDNLVRSKLNIYNLALYKEVEVNVTNWEEDELTVTVNVIERWYHIPIPIFKLIDRNFNVWWNEYNRDFSRTIYGLFYSQDNVTGNNDLLRVGFYTGFSQAASVLYRFPNINKKQTLGIEAFFRFDRNKQFQYITDENVYLFYEGDEFIRKIYHTGAVLRYRKKVHDEQFFGLFFQNTSVTDTILELNPSYYLHDEGRQNFLQFNYRFERDYRNIRAYPTKGYQWSIEVEKIGLGIFNDVDFFNIYGSYSQFLDLGKNFYLSSLIRAKISAPNEQPFFNQRGLGNDQDFVRGYEFYVIDGQEYIYSRLNLKHNFLNFELPNPLVKNKRVGKIPFRFFLKAFFDIGYVNDRFFFRNNPLNNTLLVGGGLGIDVVSLYDNVIRLEYSLSRSNGVTDKKVQNGLYLHFVMDIDDDMRILRRARNLDPK